LQREIDAAMARAKGITVDPEPEEEMQSAFARAIEERSARRQEMLRSQGTLSVVPEE
jgi:hypothetical protein